MNGVGARDLALDMAIPFKGLLNLEDEPLEALAGYAVLDACALAELISWTGRPLGDVRMEFRSEVFVSRGIRNPTVRGCPICLREDAKAHDGPPLQAMVMRGDWQFREVLLCLRHQHPLVPLWNAARPSERHDVGARLNEIIHDLMAGNLDQPRQPPTPYDCWLDSRLESGTDITWFAQHELYPAATFCRIFGHELIRLHSSVAMDKTSPKMRPHQVGFEVASKDEASILTALHDLKETATGRNEEAHAALGALFYRKTSNASFDLECFAQFRRMLQSFVLENWPIAKGAFVYGAPLPERILHSIRTASTETGLGPDLLKQLLAEIGVIDPKNNQSNTRITFRAKENAHFLSEITTWVGPLEIRQAMGATRAEFSALADGLVLVPRTHLPKVKKRWRLSDGVDLFAELMAGAVPIEAQDKCWEKLQNAKARSGVPVGSLIAAIRSERLQVGSRCDQNGYQSICVLKQEVDHLARPAQTPMSRDCISASLFGRSIGLRDKGRFLALVSKGHTPATRVRHQNTGIWQDVMTEANIAAFHSRFMTFPSMAEEFGGHWRTYWTTLCSADLTRFAPEGEDYGYLYLRKDVEPVLRRHRLIGWDQSHL